jgi:hypothetical protein
MTASSVTGVGVGTAEMTRGPGNERGLFYSVVDPHVIWHGKAEMVRGSAYVEFPSTIRVPPTHLAVFIGGLGYTSLKVIDLNGNMVGFIVVGGADFVDYIVVDANNACFCENYNTNPE